MTFRNQSHLRLLFSTVCVTVLLCVDVVFAKGPEPKWGKQVEPLFIENNEQCFRLIKILREHIMEFLEKNLFDSITDLLEFHDEYKRYIKRSPGKFVNFYSLYMPKKKNAQTYGYVLGALIEHIASILSGNSSFKNISKSMYVVSVDKYVPRNVLETLRDDTKPRKMNMYDVMACIKISINGNLGNILMNPLKGWRDPIVVMNTGSAGGAPHTGRTQLAGKWQEYVTVPTTNNYVYVSDQSNSQQIPELIYTALPFQSVTAFTQKPSLLEPYRIMKKRDKVGHDLASVSFHALPAVQNIAGVETCTATFTVSLNRISKLILFRQLLENGTFEQKIGIQGFHAIENANFIFKLNSGPLIEILQKVAMLMQDYQFLREIKYLNENLNGRSNTPSNLQSNATPSKKTVLHHSGKDIHYPHTFNLHSSSNSQSNLAAPRNRGASTTGNVKHIPIIPTAKNRVAPANRATSSKPKQR